MVSNIIYIYYYNINNSTVDIIHLWPCLEVESFCWKAFLFCHNTYSTRFVTVRPNSFTAFTYGCCSLKCNNINVILAYSFTKTHIFMSKVNYACGNYFSWKKHLHAKNKFKKLSNVIWFGKVNPFSVMGESECMNILWFNSMKL